MPYKESFMDYSRPLATILLLTLRASFPSPAGGGGSGRGLGLRSAGPWTSACKLALGLVAAFVDAFQAFRDDCLQLGNLFLLFGFSRIHPNRCYDVNSDRAACDGA